MKQICVQSWIQSFQWKQNTVTLRRLWLNHWKYMILSKLSLFACLFVCLFVGFFCVSCTFDLVWHEELLFGTNWMVQMSHDRTRMDYCILNSSMFHLKLVHTFVVHVEHKMNWLKTTISDYQNYAEILDKTSVISFNLTNPWTWMYYFATESYLGLLATFFRFYTFLIYLNLKNVHKVVLFCWP